MEASFDKAVTSPRTPGRLL